MAKKIKVKKTAHRLTHGPMDGEKVWLSSPGTLTFRCKGQVGHYNAYNTWVPSPGQA